MLIQLEIPDYDPALGIRLPVIPSGVIEAKVAGEFVIRADADGLRTLACWLLALAQPTVPAGSHLHADADVTLETGSAPFIFERA